MKTKNRNKTKQIKPKQDTGKTIFCKTIICTVSIKNDF